MALVKQKSKLKLILFTVIGFLITAAVTVALVAVVSSKIKQALHDERVHNLNILSEQINKNMQLAINLRWEEVEFFGAQFTHITYNTDEDLLAEMKLAEESITFLGRTFLIRDNGQCYTSDGESFKWPDNKVLIDMQEGESTLYIAPLQKIGGSSELMCFVKSLKEPVEVDGAKYCYVCLSSDMNTIDAFIDFTDYGNDSMMFVLNADGSILYKQEKEGKLNSLVNVLETLRLCKDFPYNDSYENIAADLAKEDPRERGGCVCATILDEEYYVAYRAFEKNDWISVLMIPETNVGNTTGEFMRTVIWSVSIVFGVAVLLLISMTIVNFNIIRINQKKVTKILYKKALYDGLTGILNRRGYDELTTDLDGKPGEKCLIIVDADAFKAVNDGYGHEEGDRVLCKIADNLVEEFGDIGKVARIGGDEFVVVIYENIPSGEEIIRKANAINERLAVPNEGGVKSSVSVGFAIKEAMLGKLYSKADEALFVSKGKGGCCCTQYTEMNAING